MPGRLENWFPQKTVSQLHLNGNYIPLQTEKAPTTKSFRKTLLFEALNIWYLITPTTLRKHLVEEGDLICVNSMAVPPMVHTVLIPMPPVNMPKQRKTRIDHVECVLGNV